jgi:hypothetical protein
MPLSLAQASVETFVRQLGALSKILDKLALHCEAKKIDPAVFLTARLFPDMLNFTRQVQIACDFAKGGGARLAGADIPAHPDVETTIPQLKERIAKVTAFLSGLDTAAVDSSADRPIEFNVGPQTMTLPGGAYLTGMVLPNFYFHTTTAYAILRANGLEIGKRDFMGIA